MAIYGWAKKISQKPSADILSEAKTTEIIFWSTLFIGIILLIFGIAVVLKSFQYGIFGFVLICVALISISIVFIWSSIKLSMMRVIMEINRSIEEIKERKK